MQIAFLIYIMQILALTLIFWIVSFEEQEAFSRTQDMNGWLCSFCDIFLYTQATDILQKAYKFVFPN